MLIKYLISLCAYYIIQSYYLFQCFSSYHMYVCAKRTHKLVNVLYLKIKYCPYFDHVTLKRTALNVSERVMTTVRIYVKIHICTFKGLTYHNRYDLYSKCWRMLPCFKTKNENKSRLISNLNTLLKSAYSLYKLSVSNKITVLH